MFRDWESQLLVLVSKNAFVSYGSYGPSRPGAVGLAPSVLLRLRRLPSRLAWRAGCRPEVRSPPRVASAGPHLVRPSWFVSWTLLACQVEGLDGRAIANPQKTCKYTRKQTRKMSVIKNAYLSINKRFYCCIESRKNDGYIQYGTAVAK